MDKEEIKKLLMKKEYAMLKDYVKQVDWKEVHKIILDLAENEDISSKSYSFIEYLIKNEENRDLLRKYHSSAATILEIAIPYYTWSYSQAIEHIKKIIAFGGNEIVNYEWILSLYMHPEKPLGDKDAENIAKMVLQRKPNSKIAKEVLRGLKKSP